MLEIGREAVYGEASDELLAEAADDLRQGSDVETIAEHEVTAGRTIRGLVRRCAGCAPRAVRQRFSMSISQPICPAHCIGKTRGCWLFPIFASGERLQLCGAGSTLAALRLLR